VLPAFGALPPLPDYVQFWMLMALGALVFVPATLLTPPERMDHLVALLRDDTAVGLVGTGPP
jgi:hypothetical protein